VSGETKRANWYVWTGRSGDGGGGGGQSKSRSREFIALRKAATAAMWTSLLDGTLHPYTRDENPPREPAAAQHVRKQSACRAYGRVSWWFYVLRLAVQAGSATVDRWRRARRGWTSRRRRSCYRVKVLTPRLRLFVLKHLSRVGDTLLYVSVGPPAAERGSLHCLLCTTVYRYAGLKGHRRTGRSSASPHCAHSGRRPRRAASDDTATPPACRLKMGSTLYCVQVSDGALA
jgi:hypothetical protein